MDYRSRRSMLPSTPPAHRRVSSTLSVASTSSSRGDTPDGGVPTNITVSVRLKPALGQPPSSAWPATGTTITAPEVGVFSFDNVFGPGATSRDVYGSVAKRIVNSVVEGYHGTIFAYGMTGTGKTYSMQGTPAAPGIIPLAAADIFAQVSFAATTISVSYLEIYNERVKDLLNPTTTEPDSLKLQDTPDGLVRVRNLRCVRVATAQELKDLVGRGDACRRTEGTEYNSVSSRSHAVLQIFLEKCDPLSRATATSVLSLCDLAGSERAAADAERRKEGAYINRSLLALGTIIARLSSSSASSSSAADSHEHIPYRDSKLTRLLQHSLSGRALVSVLCTIDTNNPSRQAVAETVNTLRFAARAKNVAIAPARATTTTSAAATAAVESLRLDLERERAETEVLKVELAEFRREAYETRARDEEKYDREKRELELQRDALKDRVSHLTRLILGGGAISSDKRDRAELDRYKARVEELERKLAEPSSMPSLPPGPDLVLEKLKAAEAEIRELKEYLADKDRIITTLKRVSTLTTRKTGLKDATPPQAADTEHALRPLDGSVMNINADTAGEPDVLVNPKVRRSAK